MKAKSIKGDSPQARQNALEKSMSDNNLRLAYHGFRVKDNGDGIPHELLDKIFQPFFTTKPTGEGTGLELSMSFDIITKGHGGMLTLDSTPDEGTVFIISIPG